METELEEIKSYKNWLGMHRMSIAQLAEAMGEPEMVLRRLFDDGKCDSIFRLCQIDQFCSIYDRVKAARQEKQSPIGYFLALFKGAHLYIPELAQAYKVWMRQMSKAKARERLIKAYMNAPWRQGSDVYIKMVTNLEQPAETYSPIVVAIGLKR